MPSRSSSGGHSKTRVARRLCRLWRRGGAFHRKDPEFAVGSDHGLFFGRFDRLFAFERALDRGRQAGGLFLLPLLLALVVFGRDILEEQFVRRTDRLVRDVAVLRQQQDLIYAGVLPLPQILSYLVGRSEAVLPGGRGGAAAGAVVVVDAGPARLVFTEQVMMAEGMEEEAGAVAADLARAIAVAVAQVEHRERDVGVDRIPHRLAFGLDDAVVLFGVLTGFLRGDKAEGERADSQFGGDADHFELRAGHPQRRMGLLARLGNHVAHGGLN